jgi:hypothetical protein
MSLAETRTEYDDVACRKALAKTIKAHAAKTKELAEIRAAIAEAEAKHAAMLTHIADTADVEDAVADFFAQMLRVRSDGRERGQGQRDHKRRFCPDGPLMTFVDQLLGFPYSEAIMRPFFLSS